MVVSIEISTLKRRRSSKVFDPRFCVKAVSFRMQSPTTKRSDGMFPAHQDIFAGQSKGACAADQYSKD